MPDTSPASQCAGGHAGVPQPQQSSSLVSRVTAAYYCQREEQMTTSGANLLQPEARMQQVLGAFLTRSLGSLERGSTLA